ncbi:integration host factor subunit beta [bacterium]|nr:integration host factor subunit beta [bacterium]
MTDDHACSHEVRADPPGGESTRIPVLERGTRMTKADIVEDIAQKTGLTKKEVGETVDLFLEEISKLLVDGHHLEIRGFGTFKVKERKERMARNPRTGDAVPVPARKVPIFKVSKMLKDRVAGTETP